MSVYVKFDASGNGNGNGNGTGISIMRIYQNNGRERGMCSEVMTIFLSYTR